ncbi:MAG: DUF2275 domain-containing protein [Deltaproteobacteria bacterium]|nr:DUF2275 domain-containing protein [Deltaproteobacteria bacterium]
MTCRQIEDLLPAYLEDVLSPQEKQCVQEHLRACESCSRALADLEATGKLLKGIEEVEPPPWLKAKIMSRLKEEGGWKERLYRRLFEPFYIKIPIQVFATVLIAVLAFSVYMKEEPELKRLSPPLPPVVEETSKDRIIAAGSAKAPESRPSGPPEKQALSLRDRAPTDAEKGALSRPAAPEQQDSFGGPPARKDIHLREERSAFPAGSATGTEKDVAAAGYSARKDETNGAESRKAGEVVQSPARQRNLQKMKAYPGAAIEEEKKQGAGLPSSERMQSIAAGSTPSIKATILAGNRNSAAEKLEDFLSDFKGRLIFRQADTEKTILIVEIPGGNLIGFLEKIETLGEVKKREAPLDFPAGPVKVLFEIFNRDEVSDIHPEGS